MREVPGSNPGATNLTEVFSWFSSIIKANAGLDFHYHDPFNLPVRVAQGVEAWPESTRLVQRIAGSNPASGMDVCVRLCVCNLKR